MEYNFNILTRGMENLDHFFIGHQPKERCQIKAGSQCIHQCSVVRRSHLNEAELRPERRFPNKFGIDCDEVGFGEGGYGLFKGLCGRDELHIFLLERIPKSVKRFSEKMRV